MACSSSEVPMGREALVGPAAEQEAARFGQVLDHPEHGDVAEVAQMPAAVLEGTGRVLIRGGRRLHDPIEGHPVDHDHIAHQVLLSPASICPPRWRSRVCILGALHGMRVAADPKLIAPSDDSLRWAPIGHSEVPVNGRGGAAQLTALREICRPSTGFLVSAYREASWPQSSSGRPSSSASWTTRAAQTRVHRLEPSC